MRIAFVYGPFGGDRPFDLANLYRSTRGLTGSEISFFKFADAMEARDAVELTACPQTDTLPGSLDLHRSA